MKRDHRYLLLAIALMLLPLVGITAAQMFPIFDPPLLRFLQPTVNRGPRSGACPPGRSCPLPGPTPGARPPVDRRPLVPVRPVEPDQPVEPPPTYVPSVSVEVGEVLTVGPDEPASVAIREADSGRYLLMFSIPRGRDGRDGDQGEQGRVGERGDSGEEGLPADPVDVNALAREVAPLLPPIIVRTIDDSGTQIDREEINLGEVLNLHHQIALPNREGS